MPNKTADGIVHIMKTQLTVEHLTQEQAEKIAIKFQSDMFGLSEWIREQTIEQNFTPEQTKEYASLQVNEYLDSRVSGFAERQRDYQYLIKCLKEQGIGV